MKLIAHRGWSAGKGENTLEAFARSARDQRLSGVEFDVRRARTGELVVAHDPPSAADSVPRLDDVLSLLSPTDLELFIEVKEVGLAPDVVDALVSANLAERAIIFAFPDVARSFPWKAPRRVRLGAIIVHPWKMNRAVRDWAPDLLFLGWDERAWTRMAFRAWWSTFSLERLGQRHTVPIVVGVVQRARDLQWLERQRIYGAVADMGKLAGEGKTR